MVALYNAFKGNFNKGYAFAGSNAFKAERIMSVKETIQTLMEEVSSLPAYSNSKITLLK